MSVNPTPNVNSKYGAPMGRPKQGHGAEPTTKFEVKRVPINSGGYDHGGAYWGTGQPLYFYIAYETAMVEYGPCEYCGKLPPYRHNECNSIDGAHHQKTREEETEISDYIRADDRDHAKEIIRKLHPTATFKR